MLLLLLQRILITVRITGLYDLKPHSTKAAEVAVIGSRQNRVRLGSQSQAGNADTKALLLLLTQMFSKLLIRNMTKNPIVLPHHKVRAIVSLLQISMCKV